VKQLILPAILTASLFGLVTRAHAQSLPASAGTVHVLMSQPFADQPGTDVTVLTVDYPPSGSTPPHEHPGHTYAYVLEGAVVSQLDDQPPQAALLCSILSVENRAGAPWLHYLPKSSFL
jgi:hypothetical protein